MSKTIADSSRKLNAAIKEMKEQKKSEQDINHRVDKDFLEDVDTFLY